MTERELALWGEYHSSERSTEARDAVFFEYLPMVKDLAWRVHRDLRLRRHVLVDDLQSAGAIALLSVLDDFDPAGGTEFRAYSLPRIRGAMVEEVKSLFWNRNREEKELCRRSWLSDASKLGGAEDDVERRDYIEHIFRPLSQIDRELILMFYSSYSIQEISRAASVSPSMAYRIRQKFFRGLGEKCAASERVRMGGRSAWTGGPRICQRCGVDFSDTPRNKQAVFCSSTCKQKAVNARNYKKKGAGDSRQSVLQGASRGA